MFRDLFKRNPHSEVPELLYRQILEQARKPEFFVEFGFDDTVMGRFDVLSLHVMMVCRRLGMSGEPNSKELSQDIFDAYVSDLDAALRTLGIGDTSVPKKKKKMVRSFYGMVEDLEKPLNERDLGNLKSGVEQRFFDGSQSGNPHRLASYMIETSKFLENQPLADVFSGIVSWPEPGGI